MFNLAVLTGRLTASPELKTTPPARLGAVGSGVYLANPIKMNISMLHKRPYKKHVTKSTLKQYRKHTIKSAATLHNNYYLKRYTQHIFNDIYNYNE